MITAYVFVLVLPFLTLATFLGTGNTAFAAAHLASLMLILAVACCDRLLHLNVRNLAPVEICWALYLGVLLIGILAGTDVTPGYDAPGALQIWVGLLAASGIMLALPALINSNRSLHGCIAALDVLGLLISTTVYLPLSGFDLGEIHRSASGSGRVFGVLGDSVAFAVVLFVCRSFVARRWGAFALHLGALMLTAGLGGILTLSVAMLAHLVLPWPASGRVAPSLRRVASFGVAIMLGLGAIAIFGQMVVERISGPNLVNVTLAQRFATFQIATEIIREHPFVGVGLRGFSNTAAALAPESLYTIGFSTNFIANAQNQILQALCDAGVLGLTALLLLVAAAAGLLRYVANSGSADAEAFRAYQVWVIGLVVGNQSAVWLLPFSTVLLLFFTVLGLALAHTWLRNAAPRTQTPAALVA